MTVLSTWPPPHQIRRSRRAKHLSLRLDARVGLEVVLPYWASERQGLRFLQANRDWVEKHFQLTETPSLAYPELIKLDFLEQQWGLNYQPNPRAGNLRLHDLEDSLVIAGKFTDFSACQPVLKRWLKKQAQQHFLVLLNQLSEQTHLPYKNLSIRGQRTIWGSCSKDKDISLNYKLLFFPRELVSYVIIHELCHTKHMDHSSRFWRLVGEFEPNYQKLKDQLKNIEGILPHWLL